MGLHTMQLPLTAEYLQGLPNGIDSHPNAKVNADIHRGAVTEFPQLCEVDGMSPALYQFLQGKSQEDWLSEVEGNVLYLLIREVVFDNDDMFLEWSYNNVCRLFRKPIYRAIMYILSPALMLMGTTKRWSRFHTGSELISDPVVRSDDIFTTRAQLSYPSHLFNDLMLRQHCLTFKAALEAAGGNDINVGHSVLSKELTCFTSKWRK